MNKPIFLILLAGIFFTFSPLFSQEECGNPIRLSTVEFNTNIDNKIISGLLILGALPGTDGFNEISIELNNANQIVFPYQDYQGENALFQKQKLLWVKVTSKSEEFKIGLTGSAWFTTDTDFVFSSELPLLALKQSIKLAKLCNTKGAKAEVSVLNSKDAKKSIVIKTSDEVFLKTLKSLLCTNKSEATQKGPDLNNDGKIDIIEFSCGPDKETFELKVNGISIQGNGEEIQNSFEIVDIDKSDNFKEIAIKEDGPSEDPYTSYYFYDGKSLIFMGKIEGYGATDGTGIIRSRTRGKILHTWYFDDFYKLSPDHKVLREEKDLYLMNSKVVCQNYLPLYKSRNSTEVLSEITPNESLKITYTDNKQWCCVEDENGVRGWFALENFNQLKGRGIDINDVFDGLVNTD